MPASSHATKAALVVLALASLATVLALLARWGWPFELFSHFRAQYAFVALLLAAYFAWRRRPVAAGLAAVLAFWNALPGVQRAMAESPDAACTGVAFSVVTANLQYSNTRHELFLEWLAAQPADLIVVQEVTHAWVQALAPLEDYPHHYFLSREDPYGIGVLSRWPLESLATIDLVGDGLPSLTGAVRIDGQRLRFLGLHTHWPVLPGLARSRDAALKRAAKAVRDSADPVILLGDLNLTPDAPAFVHLREDSGLRDVMDGRRWRPTWQAGFWPLALRIDHILVSPQLCIVQAEVGPPIGSDHRPVTARLRRSR